jgi:hypothetical protein
MVDRAMQALNSLGLDPIAESHADGHSYGFRREGRCADAMAQTHIVLSHRHGPQWILEGDIKACFDKISHEWLLTHVPMDRQVLGRWLNAGFLERHELAAAGVPRAGTDAIAPVRGGAVAGATRHEGPERGASLRARDGKAGTFSLSRILMFNL